MAKIGRKRSALFLTGAAITIIPAAAQAQDAAPDTSGDIIVTAQRQEQRLQDVPVSVTAFGAEQLRDNSIETVQDIAIRTPGLAVSAVDPKVLQALALGSAEPGTIIAAAFQELAQNAGKIGELNISPDLLQQLTHP